MKNTLKSQVKIGGRDFLYIIMLHMEEEGYAKFFPFFPYIINELPKSARIY